MAALVLASASPRRASLLRQIGLPFEVVKPDVDESPPRGMPPRTAVVEIARRKLDHVRTKRPGATILAADTTVLLGRRWIGKPSDADDARATLRQLSGRWHRVVTGIVASRATGRVRSASVETRVGFVKIPRPALEAYVATGEPLDKAGAYAIQGGGAAFVDRVVGDPSNVVGLPLAATLRLLRSVGFPLPGHLRIS